MKIVKEATHFVVDLHSDPNHKKINLPSFLLISQSLEKISHLLFRWFRKTLLL